jgi:hypothetical protein
VGGQFEKGQVLAAFFSEFFEFPSFFKNSKSIFFLLPRFSQRLVIKNIGNES